MNIFFLIYMAVIIYITIPICKIVWQEKLDKDLTFLLCLNYILIFLLTIMCSMQNYILYNVLLSFTLMIGAFFLVRKIKAIMGHYQVLSLPYFFLTVFVFANILMLI